VLGRIRQNLYFFRMAEARWKDLFTLEYLPRAVLVCLGIWLSAADSLVTTTIMPSVVRSIGGYAYFAWPVAAYLLGSILGGASAGHLAHTRGLRPALIVAALPFTLGCAAGAFSNSIAVFLAARLAQGLGAGLIVGLCYVAINAIFPKSHYNRVLALLAGIWGIATLFGPLLGGLFAQGRAWQVLFILFAVQGAIFAAAIAFLVPGNAMPPRDSDVPVRTLVLLTAAILANLVAGIVASIALSGILLAITVVFAVLALRVDMTAKAHLFPRSIADLTHGAGQGYAAIFLLNASTIGYGLYGAAILQTAYGLSPLYAGYVVAVEALAWTVMALIVAERPGSAELFWIRAGATAALLGVVSMIFTLPSGSLAAVIASASFLGGGFGMFWAFLTRRVLEFVPPAEATVGAGAIPCVQMLGSALGSAICGLIANALGVGGGFTRANVVSVAMWLFVCAVPIALAGWFFALRMSRAALVPHAGSAS
jgi:MFS family permease